MLRCMASVMRGRSGEVVWITSSSCMMMSEPMLFCRDIECSGVRSLLKVLVRGCMLRALRRRAGRPGVVRGRKKKVRIVHRCAVMG